METLLEMMRVFTNAANDLIGVNVKSIAFILPIAIIRMQTK